VQSHRHSIFVAGDLNKKIRYSLELICSNLSVKARAALCKQWFCVQYWSWIQINSSHSRMISNVRYISQ